MSTPVRIRKAWLQWVLELKHTDKRTYDELQRNQSVTRAAFEAGYRSKRRDNTVKEQKPIL